jgi:nucleoid-associated protein YgaU
MKKITLLVALCTLVLSSVQAFAADPDRMTFEQYLVEIAKYQGREQSAGQDIEALDVDIAALQAEIDAMNGQITSTWDQIYNEADTDVAGAENYEMGLDRLKEAANNFNGMSAEELLERQDGIADLLETISNAHDEQISKLSYNANDLNEIDRIMAAVQARLERAANGWYSVISGDNLWKISGKDKVYNDPFQWTRLYSANQDQISNPDLIFPEQRLAVPKAVKSGQYLVVRGDNFVAIAEKVYGNATKFRQIQEANMSLLDTMGGLYPGMILSIP